VVESDTVVGGLSRTVEIDGFRFDIGGHRFFTKVPAVERLWREILPEPDLAVRPRRSRIYYRGRFYDYPLRPLNALVNLGPVEAARSVGSYAGARLRPPADRSTLAGYVSAAYGRRLYHHFFEAYTRKVWGRPATELSAEWGAQRIKGMSLWDAVWEPLRARLVGRRRTGETTSLIETFLYPRLGPGMMWERCADLVEQAGSKVMLGAGVSRIEHSGGRAVAVTTTDDMGARTTIDADHVISSMPLPDLVRAMRPSPPDEVLAAADGLQFRAFITVALVVPERVVTWSDNWIYVHDPDVPAMRVQNFGAWSPEMVHGGRNVLGVEYTADERDPQWHLSNGELVSRAADELCALGLVRPGDVEGGYVVRMPKAYPVYDSAYTDHVRTLRNWLTTNAGNVHPVGRNGMHRYNNQDHSMLTAMLVVENIVHGTRHDSWNVNVDAEYHESASRPTPG
jgi:protoporphyrinogen oxidase